MIRKFIDWKLFTIICIIVFIQNACRFDSSFLKPYSYIGKNINMQVHHDTGFAFLHFEGDNKQPFLTDSIGHRLELRDTIQSFMIPNSNGNKINAWLLRSRTVKPEFTIIHIHGNAGSLPAHTYLMQPFLPKAYQVLLFDYSGFGFSEGKATREQSKIDAISAIKYMLALEALRNTKIILYGQSYGGHLAAALAPTFQSKIEGLVIEGAFSSPKAIANYHVPILGTLLTRTLFSAKKSIRKFHKPVLIIHSTEDKIIPFKMSEVLYHRANEPKHLLSIQHPHVYGPRFHVDSIDFYIRRMMY